MPGLQVAARGRARRALQDGAHHGGGRGFRLEGADGHAPLHGFGDIHVLGTFRGADQIWAVAPGAASTACCGAVLTASWNTSGRA